MFPETDKTDFTPIEIPRVRRGPWGYVKIGAALLAIGGAIAAWEAGYRPPLLAKQPKSVLEFVEIDRGDIDLSVVETGSIESASNTTVRCKVEALLGAVGGSQGTAKGAGAAGGGGAQGGAGGQGGSAAGGAGGGQGGAPAGGKSKTTKKAGSSSSAKTGTTTAAGSSSASGGGASSSSSGGASGSAGSSGSPGGGTGTTAGSKPVIRSFTYAVSPHVALRPVTVKAATTTTQQKMPMAGGRGGGGGGPGGKGGGRGGRGPGGGGGMMDEAKAGSTTIVEIVPEGKRVKAGEVVCKLDASAFQDEEQAQLIRYLQAKSYVEQANSILEVNEITLREYRDGIYPQDLQLVRQYVETCQMERDRLQRNAVWSVDMHKKGYRTHFQVNGDLLAVDQANIALGEALNMVNRLTKQTGPKILKSLEANVRAIEADKLLQDAAFSLERQRLERIRRNIANCTLRAPHEGILVYVNQADGNGRVRTPIDEGVTVRQDQPIFNLPDPLHMRVKARINESKFALVQTGQAVRVVIDAFPERPLRGRVGEIAAINIPLNQSDVRIYYANVDIIDEFEDLRPGLSAECVFHIDSRHDVTRVPLESIRWVRGQTYVALYSRSLAEAGGTPWNWRKIELGVSDSRYAEVVSGIQAGDRVVTMPQDLPEPGGTTPGPPATNLAGLAL